jgi:hypothetical protein
MKKRSMLVPENVPLTRDVRLEDIPVRMIPLYHHVAEWRCNISTLVPKHRWKLFLERMKEKGPKLGELWDGRVVVAFDGSTPEEEITNEFEVQTGRSDSYHVVLKQGYWALEEK